MDPTVLWSFISCHLRHFTQAWLQTRRDYSRSCKYFWYSMALDTRTWLALAILFFFCQFCVHFCLHFCRHRLPLCFGMYSNWIMTLITMLILHQHPQLSNWTDYCSSTLPYRPTTISWLPPSYWNIRFLWWLPPILWSRMLTYNCYIFPTQPILLYNLHFVLSSAQNHLFRPIMYYATDLSALKNMQLQWTPPINWIRLCIYYLWSRHSIRNIWD